MCLRVVWRNYTSRSKTRQFFMTHVSIRLQSSYICISSDMIINKRQTSYLCLGLEMVVGAYSVAIPSNYWHGLLNSNQEFKSWWWTATTTVSITTGWPKTISGDSSVVTAPDSWWKGRGFESAAVEFSSPGSTLYTDSYFRICCMSFCQRCRWQVTAKRLCTPHMWLRRKWHCKLAHGCMVYTEDAPRRHQFHVPPT